MAVVNLLIPKLPDEYISKEVLNAVTLDYHLYVGNSTISSEEKNKLKRIISIRNILRETPNLIANKYTLLLDSDTVIPLFSDVKAKEFLELHHGYKGVGIPYGYVFSSHHVSCAALLIETDVLVNIPFRYEEGICECQAFCNDIRYMGFEVIYLQDVGYCYETTNKR